MTSRLSAVLREALIRFSHGLLAIGAFEAANGKVTSRHFLEMLDERVVHGSAAQRTDERNAECPTFFTASESRSFDTLNLSAQY
jgi:hypothetical protein